MPNTRAPCIICGERTNTPHFPNKWSLSKQPDETLPKGHKDVS